MPRPITVWMVHLEHGADLREVRGTLRLEEDALVFEARGDGPTTSFPFASLRRAKRTIGSPVMVLRWELSGLRRETAFYFAQPPPMPGSTADAPVAGRLPTTERPGPFASSRQPSRRRQRKQAITYMAARSGETREAIRAWVSAIGAAINERSGEGA